MAFLIKLLWQSHLHELIPPRHIFKSPRNVVKIKEQVHFWSEMCMSFPYQKPPGDLKNANRLSYS